MEDETFFERLRRELPRLLRERPDLRAEVVAILEENLAPRRDVVVILEEIRALRQDFNRMVERQDRLEVRQGGLEERQDRFEAEMVRLREDFNRGLAEVRAHLERHDEDIRTLREDFNRTMAEVRAHLQRHDEDIRTLREDLNRGFAEAARRDEELREEFHRGFAELSTALISLRRTVDAIGTRWGLMSEDTFRRGLAGLVEERFGVRVQHWEAYDSQGFVFGYPQQVEIDVAVQDAEHLVIEIKASTSEDDVPTLVRKREFYSRQQRVPARLVLISPFVYPRAMTMLSDQGIAVYTSMV